MEQLLEELRRTKFPLNMRRKEASNYKGCYVMTFGLTGLNGRTWESVQNKHHEKLYLLLKNYALELNKNHKYTSITVNKNFQSYPHYDKNNEGASMIIAIGNFTGGNLNIEGESIDIHNKICYFNGSEKLHSTEPFIGERYSIIFYTRRLK